MNINLMQFQLKAIKELLESMEGSGRDIILKSPTGSGKTIILTHFMDEYMQGHSKTVFIWLTPGTGNLEEQSKAKMDKYIHNSHTKLLSDIMTSGFAEDDACFINWEKLNRAGNNALRDSERTNFYEWIDKAFDNELSFKVIIDESHQNFTDRADTIVQLFRADKIIRCSATPLPNAGAKLIEVPEEDVIAEGLIKKLIVVNEDFPQRLQLNDDYAKSDYLLDKALQKQQELHSLFLQRGKDINPLIIVQLPNNSDILLDTVENFFEQKGITYDAGTLAVWLSDRHENLESLSENNGKQVAVIIKQAVATGWDCPRAHILVKLRFTHNESFTIQTIGRIRRMPEAKHYDNDALDSCYLYTFDDTFTQGAKTALEKSVFEAKILHLKEVHKEFNLIKEQRTMITDLRDSRQALASIAQYMENEYGLTRDKKQNRTRMESNGYIFSDKIERYTISGKVIAPNELSKHTGMNIVKVVEAINTHVHGREYHHEVGKIGLEIGIQYSNMNTIISRLLSEKSSYHRQMLSLPTRELYAFVINNSDLLRRMCREAMAAQLAQQSISGNFISEKDFRFPQSTLFTYNAQNKVQTVSDQSVYEDYLLSAEPRSSSEKKFEKFCEDCHAVDWVYKNGDKGDEYFSILYQDGSNAQRLFYPDYIVSVRDETWIIETKGGFTASGESEDIDIYSPKKFDALKKYLSKHGLKGGFVRYDKQSEELCICVDNYNEDIHSDSWIILKDLWK